MVHGVCPWRLSPTEIHRAATIVADRLCGAIANPIIRIVGYEAGELIDWVWEHRVDDLAKFGL